MRVQIDTERCFRADEAHRIQSFEERRRRFVKMVEADDARIPFVRGELKAVPKQRRHISIIRLIKSVLP